MTLGAGGELFGHKFGPFLIPPSWRLTAKTIPEIAGAG